MFYGFYGDCLWEETPKSYSENLEIWDWQKKFFSSRNFFRFFLTQKYSILRAFLAEIFFLVEKKVFDISQIPKFWNFEIADQFRRIGVFPMRTSPRVAIAASQRSCIRERCISIGRNRGIESNKFNYRDSKTIHLITAQYITIKIDEFLVFQMFVPKIMELWKLSSAIFGRKAKKPEIYQW